MVTELGTGFNGSLVVNLSHEITLQISILAEVGDFFRTKEADYDRLHIRETVLNDKCVGLHNVLGVGTSPWLGSIVLAAEMSS